MKSVFMITIGPAGSGKSNIIGELKDYINKHYNDINPGIYESGSIDDYVEHDRTYIREIINLIVTDIFLDDKMNGKMDGKINGKMKDYIITNSQKQNSDIEIENYINNQESGIDLLNDITQKMTNLYMIVRRKYDNENNTNLKKWINERKNIIFETTGQTNLDWLFEGEFFTKDTIDDYLIIMAYPYVEKKEILSRALNRFAERVKFFYDNYYHNRVFDIEEYIRDVMSNKMVNNKRVEPPRLPFIFYGNNPLTEAVDAIQRNIIGILKKCIKVYDTKTLKNNTKIRVDKFLAYDVNHRDVKLMIDIDCNNATIDKSYCQDPSKIYDKKNGDHFIQNLLLGIDMLCHNVSNSNTSIIRSSQNGGKVYYDIYIKNKRSYYSIK